MSGISTFYFICFVAGFVLTILSLLLGHFHLHLHLHSLDGGIHGLPHGGVDLQHGAGTPAHAGAAAAGMEISPINFSTVMAFLTWFGGMGYLLTHYYRFWILMGLGLATLSGLIGGAIVFWFMAKFLAPRQTQLDPEDFEMVGTLARISLPIREQGTGEIIFSLGGTRRAAGARSADGSVIGKDEEVVITKYEKGIAYVQRWEDFSQEKN